MILLRIIALFAVAAVGCGGGSMANVKGQLSFNGAPLALPAGAGEVFIVFNLLDAEGKPVKFQMFTSVVQPDGSFEVVNSAGELPPGTYQVGIDADPKKFEQAKAFALPKSEARVTFAAGTNAVQIDLAKPKG